MSEGRFKFRVFRKHTDDFKKYGYYRDDDLLLKIDCGKVCEIENVYNDYDLLVNLTDQDYTIQQCTGLKDKNGKLIYEGDILEREPRRHFYTVLYSSYRFVARSSNTGTHYDLSVPQVYKIIGNIFEDPELVE